MSQAHRRARVELAKAQARFVRRKSEHETDPGSVPAEKAYRAAKHELDEWVSEYRRTRPAASHTLNGDATAQPETLKIRKTQQGDK
jgi:hypothetical protein